MKRKHHTIIDPHVHLRGEEYFAHPFLQYAISDCRACGIGMVAEMPNAKVLDGYLIDHKTVEHRIEQTTLLSANSPIIYVNIGLTNDLLQVKKAVNLSHLAYGGLKIFFTHSTGDMGILDLKVQKKIWRALQNYRGVVMGHFEDETEWFVGYHSSAPLNHSLRQNSESEYIQVERQLRNAYDAKFAGTFYICHVSNPATFDLVKTFRRSNPGFKIVTEVTWHHMFLNYDDYLTHRNRVKMNPPLRSPRSQELILEAVVNGTATLIGSDHAPHPLKAKDSFKPPSGIPALPFWPKGIQLLRRLKVSEERIADLTYRNAQKIFGFHEYKKGLHDTTYNPTLWDKYGWNPFSRVDK